MSQTNQPTNNDDDTRFTKIFVGNLAWRTTSDDLTRFFQQFGEVIHSNVVCETYPGRSKGYGFVTFRDAISTLRALENSNPVIDGRTTNCNLATLRAKQNMNQPPNQNGSFNHVIPPYDYYYHHPSPQHGLPYCPPPIWDPVSGQYIYMYNNPYWYAHPTQMIHNQCDFTYMTHYWQHTNSRRHVEPAPQISSVQIDEIINETDQEVAPQRSSVPTESISETDQELIADVVHHDIEEAVRKPESDDVDQQKAKNQKGKNIGQDGDIKKDARDQEENINEQEDSSKQDGDEEINGIKKDVEDQEVAIMCEQKHGTKQGEDVTKEFDYGIEVTHQEERLLEDVDENTP